jgi:hypothetical protein
MTKDITIDKGGTNAMLIYAKKVEKLTGKALTVLAMPSSTQNWPSKGGDTDTYPLKPIIVDLIRITKRFNIDGAISATYSDTFEAICEAGGTFTMEYAGTDYTVNMEKYSIIEFPQDAQGTDSELGGSAVPDHFDVRFTVVEGVNYGD